MTLFCFNPRARVGRDDRFDVCIIDTNPFQSTRPRRARRALDVLGTGEVGVSIHAPA